MSLIYYNLYYFLCSPNKLRSVETGSHVVLSVLWLLPYGLSPVIIVIDQ